MILHRAPWRVVALVLGGFRLLFPQESTEGILRGEVPMGAAKESVYTHPVWQPDFLARYIVVPLPRRLSARLNLVGWSYRPAADTIGVPEKVPADTSLLELHISPEAARDILRRGKDMLPLTVPGLDRWSEVDSTGIWITFHEDHAETALKLPSTVPLAWYIPHRMENRFRTLARDKLSSALQPVGTQQAQRGGTIELLGADIAGQRVSLRVSGNVAINGGLVFKNQSKSYTNDRAARNWDIDVDQKQRFDIEGTIGERVSVLVHQDSENDFEWENDMKIAYMGEEDEILQRIDAGNISLSLPGTQFATGGSGKSSGLFGIKAQSKLGPVDLTTVASIERSRKSSKSSTLAREFTISDMYYMANRYFFLDLQFRDKYYPLFEDGTHGFDPARMVSQLVVYRSVSRQEADTYSGTAYVDPKEVDPAYATQGNFKRLLEGTDYTFSPQLGWIRLKSPASDYEMIAVAYLVGDTAAVVDTVGDIGNTATDTTATDLTLKLIKARGQTASHPTWPLEFKNVYSLGGVNINPEGFEVKIINTEGITEGDDRFTNGMSYLTIFGLDREDDNRAPVPDEIIDARNINLVNLAQGELHFPALLPFTYSDVKGLATNDPAIKKVYGYELEDPNQNFREDDDEDISPKNGKWDVPAIYYKPKNPNAKNEESRFEITVKQSSRGASEYNLGFNLVEGSETVYINGNPLNRVDDYRIDYFSGTLTILDMSKYGADPDITIDYEENILISFDKKVMLGTRAEMDLGEGSFLGVTGLYYNQSIVDERIDVGSEPIQNMLWDINGRITREAPLLTRLVDRLPLVETDAASRFRFEGEIARVLPNPNPLGKAFVDDFEAAKRTTSPSLQYRAWRHSSAPAGKRQGDRRKLAWWNPYADVNVKNIWPERETSIRARNLTTTVLVLDALFEEGYDGAVNEDLWGGITYPLMPSDYDQTLSKFFEVWVKGTEGHLHIDVGSISEDLNANGIIDTEDRPVAGFSEGNSLLEPEEDVGLDGCPDAYEDGMGGCTFFSVDGEDDFWDFNDDGFIDAEEQKIAEKITNNNDEGNSDEDEAAVADSIYQGLYDYDYDRIYDGPLVPWADPDDPNGDNFLNTQASNPAYSGNRNDNINGTEGNSRVQEGSYPDSEDLDGLGGTYPEKQNDYFTYSFQLDADHPDFDPSIVGGETERSDGSLTGWRLFRIPLTDFRLEGGMTASWDNVRHLRFWIDGLGGSQSPSGLNARIQIAKIEFVGNEWEELGIAHRDSSNWELDEQGARLTVTVANTEDNADYTTPPGVEREYDRLNDIRLREQSLVLDFRLRGIPKQHKGAIKKSVPKQTGTFLVYGSMDLFVYAEGDLIGEDSTCAKFWFRLGQGEDNYYEVRKLVYAGSSSEKDNGWNKRNHLSISLDNLASLKLRDTPDMTIIVDTCTIPGYYLIDNAGDSMEVYIRGEPSLERIDRYIAGVINTHKSKTLKGLVMIDDLHLSDVKREGGVAMRLGGAVNFADLLSTSFNYARKDADFHTVQQRVSRNAATNENWRADVTFSPHRFLPQSWGVRTPLNINYSSATSTPKYLPGKDIPTETITRDSILQTVLKQSRQFSVKTSFDKSTRSKNWLVRQTLDRLKSSVSYARKLESTELIKSNEVRNVSGQLAYPIKFSEENYIQPFKALVAIPWLGERIKDTRLYYAPTNVDFSANLTQSLNERITRALPDTTMDTFNFNMARSVKARYRLTDRLSADYSWNANNILNDFRDRELETLKTLNPGKLRQFAEQFSTSYNPELISWLKPKFMYQANYNWVKNAPIDSLARGGKIAAQGRLTGSVNLQLKDIIEVFYTPEGRAGTGAGRARRRGSQTEGAQSSRSQKPFEVANPRLKALIKLLHTAAGKVAPITFNYGYNRRAGESAVRGQPDYVYRLALVTESGLVADTARFNTATISEGQDMSWRSGLNLSRSVNLNFSYSRKMSETHSPSAVTRTWNWNWLYLKDHANSGIPFVNWSLRWSNLEKLPLLNKIPWRVSLDHNYSGNHTRNIQNDNAPIDKYTRQFQPLAGFNINFNNGISTNIRASHTLTLNHSESGDSRRTSRQITASVGYQHRGGLTIPLPFFDDIKMQNTVNFNLDFDFTSNDLEELKGEGTDYTTRSWSKKWSIAPRITYTFTNKVTGGFRIVYEEHDDYVSGKRINRDFKFDVNIAIRGS